MKHLATIQVEFLKAAAKWEDLSYEAQKAYLQQHRKSKKKMTAKPGEGGADVSELKESISKKRESIPGTMIVSGLDAGGGATIDLYYDKDEHKIIEIKQFADSTELKTEIDVDDFDSSVYGSILDSGDISDKIEEIDNAESDDTTVDTVSIDKFVSVHKLSKVGEVSDKGWQQVKPLKADPDFVKNFYFDLQEKGWEGLGIDPKGHAKAHLKKGDSKLTLFQEYGEEPKEDKIYIRLK